MESNKIIIELDGLQHFEQVSTWSSPEKTHATDVFKMNCANKNGFSIIRLLQNDVYYNKYDWLTELKINIEILKDGTDVKNIYMSKKNEYAIFNV